MSYKYSVALNIEFRKCLQMLNVESSHLYQDCEQFFRECARVLREGGYLCWIDLRYKTQVQDTRRQAITAGLVEERWDDITMNVLQGINRTAARYDRLLDKVINCIISSHDDIY
ncbi:unnamed protein product [Strongylus vulgaris]|uniref:Methyltransferase type 11 domain-containing protein n=1 Tax=Strongylus vulgaris TaxID=40348 RepID=A0A3P7JCY8_STRVU|nr:unnamed protein product [Strongylus vulgaris]